MKRLVLATLLAIGCGSSSDNLPDLGANADLSVQQCTPNAKECVTDALARVCPADGVAWLAVQCGPGTKCMNGDCVVDVASQPCTPADNFCGDASTALQCNADGVGFTMVSCPANTTCVEGACVGACTVGQSFCLSPGYVSTCKDGQTFTTSACPSGQLCARSDSGTGAGSCQPATCTPDDKNGCNTVCGNKVADPADTDPTYVSTCVETARGWRWQSSNCPVGSCDPTGAQCSVASAHQATCKSDCTPGELRCDNTGKGTQVCGSDGKWGAATACSGNEICVHDSNQKVLGCGDFVCDGLVAGVDGSCPDVAGTNQIFYCDATGNLASAATTCAAGVCVPDSRRVDPATGQRSATCGYECAPGSSRCVGGATGAVQTCDANGHWNPQTTPCVTDGGTQACYGYTDPSTGQARAACGVCAPGSTRCVTMNGDAGAGTDAQQTCGSDGKWQPATTCVSSYCKVDHCVADCRPGSTLCAGGPASALPPPGNIGTTDEATCTQDGRIGMPVACSNGTSCRKDPNGVAYGCVQCVGSGPNEANMTDTRCNPTPPPTGTETCQPDNTTWSTPTACPSGDTCHEQSIPEPVCGSCTFIVCFPGPIPGAPFCFPTTVNPCTEAAASAAGGCAAAGQGSSGQCGATADCCSNACGGAPVNPAYCGP